MIFILFAQFPGLLIGLDFFDSNNIMTITFIMHMFLSELKDILRCLEDDGIRAMFTDSKTQYHHSIRKVKHVCQV